MTEFKTVKIGDVVKVKGGKRLPLKHELIRTKTTHPYIRARDIGNGKITFDDPVYVSDNTFSTIKNYTVCKNDVCITIVGANVGDIGIVPAHLDGGNLTENAVKLFFKNTQNDNRFLKYSLLTSEIKSQMKQLAGGGAAQPKLGLYKINELNIPYPSVAIQSRIASVLSAYDDLIENNEKRIKTLEEMAQLLYTEWFVKFKFPGHEKVKMVESGTEYGLVPEGWEVKRLSDIANDKRDQVHPSQIKPNTPYVGLEHIPRKTITLTNWGTAVEVQSGKLSFQTGNILFGKIRPYFHKVVSAPINGITSTDTIVIVTKNERYNAFALMCVSSENFVSYATKTSQGTKMPRADWKTLMKYPVVVPPDILLRPFNALINDSITEMKTLMIRNRKLIELRNLLIPELVTGKRELK